MAAYLEIGKLLEELPDVIYTVCEALKPGLSDLGALQALQRVKSTLYTLQLQYIDVRWQAGEIKYAAAICPIAQGMESSEVEEARYLNHAVIIWLHYDQCLHSRSHARHIPDLPVLAADLQRGRVPVSCQPCFANYAQGLCSTDAPPEKFLYKHNSA